MTSSLVGSEMCIRDRLMAMMRRLFHPLGPGAAASRIAYKPRLSCLAVICLLYTSDAADDA
eukprot:417912-Prorocentrum_lima.AAC.1